MAWNPTYTTFNCRAIADNLLTYFNTNQADALTWANGAAGLRSFQSISDSVADRSVPVFPALQFSDDNDATIYTDDILQAGYQVTFDVMVNHSVPSSAVSQARVYAKAIASMIRNCPLSTLAANTGAHADSTVIESIEIGFDPIKTNEQQNDFLQIFQVRATFRLMGI